MDIREEVKMQEQILKLTEDILILQKQMGDIVGLVKELTQVMIDSKKVSQ